MILKGDDEENMLIIGDVEIQKEETEVNRKIGQHKTDQDRTEKFITQQSTTERNRTERNEKSTKTRKKR